MHILLDARMMGPLATRGIGRYIEELVRALLQLNTDDTYTLLVRSLEGSPFLSHPRVTHVHTDVPWYGLREQWAMPSRLRMEADVVHVPHWNVPLGYRGEPLVVTIHDLLLYHQTTSAKASRRHPFVRKAKAWGHRLTVSHAVTTAGRILVPTQAVAADVARFFPQDAEKIVVTGEGVTALPTGDARLLETHHLRPHQYLLYVGSAYPHKRLDVLLAAWKGMEAKYPTHELVIAGEEDVFMAEYIAQVKKERIPRVRFTGRIPDAMYATLLEQASAFVYPTSFEGFGLPPLEALSKGTPVIASDIAVLREVLPSDGVRFFRMGERDDMMRTIDHVLRDRAKIQERVHALRSEVFSRHRWLDAAERTRAAYARVASPSQRGS